MLPALPTSPLKPPVPQTRARVAVTIDAAGVHESAARAHAQTMDLPFVTADQRHDYDLYLAHTVERLELRDGHDARVGPVYVDFTHLDLRSYGPNLSRRQPLARAMGKKARRIVDATTGLAHDALLLAAMGYHVTAIERNPICAALVRDGLDRLAAAKNPAHPALGRLQLLCADARTELPRLTPRPDVIYLDPMFPPKRKRSAAVNKEMRLLRALVGDDEDAQELLQISLGCANERVVVKRPEHAPPLRPNPMICFSGKLVRYDVYRANV